MPHPSEKKHRIAQNHEKGLLNTSLFHFTHALPYQLYKMKLIQYFHGLQKNIYICRLT